MQNIYKIEQSNESLWEPIENNQVRFLRESLLQKKTLTKDEIEILQNKSKQILSKSINPKNKGNEQNCGLIVGHVQSGKTLSMTSVAANACDNKFPIVIFLTGRQGNLYHQTVQRLFNDLGTNSRNSSSWRTIQSPDPSSHSTHIQTALERFHNPNKFSTPRTLLITILKQYSNINKLTEILSNRGISNLVSKSPTLIIDDECDNASLDNHASTAKDSTSTYNSITLLRKSLPKHTYLGYTATPQANIFISMMDHLSPDFATTLAPGDGYIGPEKIFLPKSAYAKTLPFEDITEENNVLHRTPESLRNALSIFLTACAIQLIRESQDLDMDFPYSMMINPGLKNELHNKYEGWIIDLTNTWGNDLRIDDDNLGTKARLKSQFLKCHEELSRTDPKLPPFKEVWEAIPAVLQNLLISKLNQFNNDTENIDSFWNSERFHILIGGQLLSRGFTLEGLITTYLCLPMARTPTIDTVMQRARFFGYRKNELPLTRIFIEKEHQELYHNNAAAAAALYESIKKHSESNAHFRTFKRRLFLDPSYRATRTAVISDKTTRSTIRKNTWAHFLPPYGDNLTNKSNANTNAFQQFLEDNHFLQFKETQHFYCETSLKNIVNLILDWEVPNYHSNATNRKAELDFILSWWMDQNPSMKVYLFEMRKGVKTTYRSLVNQQNPTINPHSGTASGGVKDREVKFPDKICAQIAYYDKLYQDSNQQTVIAENIHGLSINLASFVQPTYGIRE